MRAQHGAQAQDEHQRPQGIADTLFYRFGNLRQRHAQQHAGCESREQKGRKRVDLAD
jgi:hypothetical protein